MIDKSDLQAERDLFWRNGYLVVRNAFKAEEMASVKRAIGLNTRMNQRVEIVRHKISQGQAPGFDTIVVWNDTAGDDIFARVTRSHRIMDRMEFFFDDNVYVYHNKVALKYPGIVGFRLHQDYAYWYEMGNLYPDMATVMIAVDPATEDNGCIRFIDGSHKLGRIEHDLSAGVSESGIGEERLAHIKQRLPETPVELDVGDMAFFHCNTIHGSGDNQSSDSRLALLGCYNTKHNSPYASKSHPPYQPQSKFYEEVTEADVDKQPDFGLKFSFG